MTRPAGHHPAGRDAGWCNGQHVRLWTGERRIESSARSDALVAQLVGGSGMRCRAVHVRIVSRALTESPAAYPAPRSTLGEMVCRCSSRWLSTALVMRRTRVRFPPPALADVAQVVERFAHNGEVPGFETPRRHHALVVERGYTPASDAGADQAWGFDSPRAHPARHPCTPGGPADGRESGSSAGAQRRLASLACGVRLPVDPPVTQALQRRPVTPERRPSRCRQAPDRSRTGRDTRWSTLSSWPRR